METVLDRFNLTEVAFEHEQRRLVKYLSDAFAPLSFKSVVTTRLTLQCYKPYKHTVLSFWAWVIQLMRDFMTFERASQSALGSQYPHCGSSREGRSVLANPGQETGGSRGGSGDSRGGRGGRGGSGNNSSTAPTDSGADAGLSRSAFNTTSDHRACLKCASSEHQVRDCPSCQPGEAQELLRA